MMDKVMAAIRALIEHDDLPSILLMGPPGVGKTAAPFQAARATGLSSDQVTKVYLTLVDPTDTRGLPYITEIERNGRVEKTAVWAWPAFLPRDDGRVHLVILDDVTNAPTTVQSIAYGLVLERKAGEHDLSHCRFVATGNRVEDRSGAYALSAALLNRFMMLPVKAVHREWRSWAILHGIDPLVVGYLDWKAGSAEAEENPALFSFDPDRVRKGEPFPTPRAWEAVHKVLRRLGPDPYYLTGCVGEAHAVEFAQFCRVKDQLPDPELVLRGEEDRVPTEIGALYATASSLVAAVRARAETNGELVKGLDNLIGYVSRIQVEFGTLILKDLLRIPEVGESRILERSREFLRWTKENGDLLFEEEGAVP